MAIKLPQNAHGYDYEDQVCSLLHAHGFYLDTRLILKKGTEEVLEFDAIATPVNNYKDRTIVEVKSGDWGLADVFKLFGQILYTNESKAWLIHKKEIRATKSEAIKEVLKKVPVSTKYVNLDEENKSLDLPEGLEIDDTIRKHIFVASWWARSAERIAQKHFKDWRQNNKDKTDITETVNKYLHSVDGCVFKDSPIKRVDSLYDAYKAAPQISTNLMTFEATSSGKDLMGIRKKVANQLEYVHIQFVMAKEQRARVAILKNAYDSILEERDKREENGTPFAIDGLIKSLLPASFNNGMNALNTYRYPERVPFFLQIFIDVFGGFYLPDNALELETISKATGIPEEDIPMVLDIYNKFFPIPNGWIHYGDRVRFIKGIPAYMRGAGCFIRENIHGENWGKNFPQLSFQIPAWHNTLYKLLEPFLKVADV